MNASLKEYGISCLRLCDDDSSGRTAHFKFSNNCLYLRFSGDGGHIELPSETVLCHKECAWSLQTLVEKIKFLETQIKCLQADHVLMQEKLRQAEDARHDQNVILESIQKELITCAVDVADQQAKNQTLNATLSLEKDQLANYANTCQNNAFSLQESRDNLLVSLLTHNNARVSALEVYSQQCFPQNSDTLDELSILKKEIQILKEINKERWPYLRLYNSLAEFASNFQVAFAPLSAWSNNQAAFVKSIEPTIGHKSAPQSQTLIPYCKDNRPHLTTKVTGEGLLLKVHGRRETDPCFGIASYTKTSLITVIFPRLFASLPHLEVHASLIGAALPSYVKVTKCVSDNFFSCSLQCYTDEWHAENPGIMKIQLLWYCSVSTQREDT